jgi:hypothetical protein
MAIEEVGGRGRGGQCDRRWAPPRSRGQDWREQLVDEGEEEVEAGGWEGGRR